MIIMMQDPAKVDAVISKIAEMYGVEDPEFIENELPGLKKRLDSGNTAYLELVAYTDMAFLIYMDKYPFYDITDTDFLNDKK